MQDICQTVFPLFTVALPKTKPGHMRLLRELSQICLILFLYLCGETLLDC